MGGGGNGDGVAVPNKATPDPHPTAAAAAGRGEKGERLDPMQMRVMCVSFIAAVGAVAAKLHTTEPLLHAFHKGMSVNPFEWGVAESSLVFTVVFSVQVLLLPPLFDVLSQLTPDRIEGKGKHLDELSRLDWVFIHFNWCTTPLFVYHLYREVWRGCPWSLQELTLTNTVVAYVGMFALYDLVYVLFHGALHHRSIYKYVHKHHHKQNVPTRGNIDAVNVHPFEFVSGEYIHILCVVCIPCHAVTVLAFLLSGALMASLNHTRLDIRVKLPIVGKTVYAVQAHDIHHHLNTANYGQYTMFWDGLFGTYRDE